MEAVTVLHRGGSPHYNLALEEAILNHVNRGVLREVVRIWVNPPSVIIGYMLPPCSEVRCKVVEELGLPIVRRPSGGGAVYHDWGNINISVFVPLRLNVEKVYEMGTGIILKALSLLGLKAHVENTSDVVVEGWKVSGSAAVVKASASLFHATLLVEADLETLKRVLKPRLEDVVKGKVTPAKYRPNNLKNLAGVSMREALRALLETVSKSSLGLELPKTVWGEAEKLYWEKYTTSKWSPLGPKWLEKPLPITL